MNDPYLQENGTLKNHLGITDAQELSFVEAAYTRTRQIELAEGSGPHGQFDLQHLKAIHHHLFQDVYAFSGKLRGELTTIDASRSRCMATCTRVIRPSRIPRRSSRT